jgi:hypothetical protein
LRLLSQRYLAALGDFCAVLGRTVFVLIKPITSFAVFYPGMHTSMFVRILRSVPANPLLCELLPKEIQILVRFRVPWSEGVRNPATSWAVNTQQDVKSETTTGALSN